MDQSQPEPSGVVSFDAFVASMDHLAPDPQTCRAAWEDATSQSHPTVEGVQYLGVLELGALICHFPSILRGSSFSDEVEKGPLAPMRNWRAKQDYWGPFSDFFSQKIRSLEEKGRTGEARAMNKGLQYVNSVLDEEAAMAHEEARGVVEFSMIKKRDEDSYLFNQHASEIEFDEKNGVVRAVFHREDCNTSLKDLFHTNSPIDPIYGFGAVFVTDSIEAEWKVLEQSPDVAVVEVPEDTCMQCRAHVFVIANLDSPLFRYWRVNELNPFDPVGLNFSNQSIYQVAAELSDERKELTPRYAPWTRTSLYESLEEATPHSHIQNLLVETYRNQPYRLWSTQFASSVTYCWGNTGERLCDSQCESLCMETLLSRERLGERPGAGKVNFFSALFSTGALICCYAISLFYTSNSGAQSMATTFGLATAATACLLLNGIVAYAKGGNMEFLSGAILVTLVYLQTLMNTFGCVQCQGRAVWLFLLACVLALVALARAVFKIVERHHPYNHTAPLHTQIEAARVMRRNTLLPHVLAIVAGVMTLFLLFIWPGSTDEWGSDTTVWVRLADGKERMKMEGEGVRVDSTVWSPMPTCMGGLRSLTPGITITPNDEGAWLVTTAEGVAGLTMPHMPLKVECTPLRNITILATPFGFDAAAGRDYTLPGDSTVPGVSLNVVDGLLGSSLFATIAAWACVNAGLIVAFLSFCFHLGAHLNLTAPAKAKGGMSNNEALEGHIYNYKSSVALMAQKERVKRQESHGEMDGAVSVGQVAISDPPRPSGRPKPLLEGVQEAESEGDE